MLKPARIKRAAAAPALLAPVAKLEPKPVDEPKSSAAPKPPKIKVKSQRAPRQPVKIERKIMSKSPAEEEKIPPTNRRHQQSS
ncbi:MAG: hypothetical protein U0Y68_03870 [Blastocatellia bacterium]